ncbi:MAG TPA: class II aldolase/adducin family protein [Rhodopila sp.]|nr:class II aldolase/adducin family protein [Rhodopila sp.]
MPTPRENLVIANRILARRGVVDGFGHVSIRDEHRPDCFIMARSMAPALVTVDDLMRFDLDANPTDPDAPRPYLERFIHSEIYRLRPDVMAVVHHHAPSIIPFGATKTPLRPIYHMSGFLGAGVPVFDIRCDSGETDMLIRTRELGRAHANCLGPCAATLMRGHGATVVGSSLQQVVYRSVYMEMNARLQADAMRLGDPIYLTEIEARLASATNDGQLQRPWDLWAQEVTEASD